MRAPPTAEQLAMAPWMRFAREHLGVTEYPGDRDNPVIVEWIRACAPSRPWLARDATPHCSAFANAAMHAVGINGTRSLAARSWLRWGDEIELRDVRYGDVCVLWRGAPLPASVVNAPGHVAFVDRVVGEQVLLHGANQLNKVSIAPYPLRRVLGFRRPALADLSLLRLMRAR